MSSIRISSSAKNFTHLVAVHTAVEARRRNRDDEVAVLVDLSTSTKPDAEESSLHIRNRALVRACSITYRIGGVLTRPECVMRFSSVASETGVGAARAVLTRPSASVKYVVNATISTCKFVKVKEGKAKACRTADKEEVRKQKKPKLDVRRPGELAGRLRA